MDKNDLIQALSNASGFEVVSQGEPTSSSLRLVGRAPNDRRADMMQLFNALQDGVVQDGSWSVDLSKYYFRPSGATQNVWAWRFIFGSAAGALPYDKIIRAIQGMRPISRVYGGPPLEEIPIHGQRNRNAYNAAGKGAAPTGKAIVGPARRPA